jgi:hypothetical protein
MKFTRSSFGTLDEAVASLTSDTLAALIAFSLKALKGLILVSWQRL